MTSLAATVALPHQRRASVTARNDDRDLEGESGAAGRYRRSAETFPAQSGGTSPLFGLLNCYPGSQKMKWRWAESEESRFLFGDNWETETVGSYRTTRGGGVRRVQISIPPDLGKRNLRLVSVYEERP